MNIRRANINDIDNNLLNIFIDGFEFHLNGRKDIFDNNKKNDDLKKDLDQKKQQLQLYRLQNLINLIENKNVLVAEKNNNILGFIIFEIKDKCSKTLWIDQLVVDEKERGKGISSLLIKKAEEIAKKEKCIRVEFCCWSFNKRANEIYNHLGFKEQRVIFEKEI